MLLSTLAVTPRINDLLEKGSNIPLQLTTPIEEATADELGLISPAHAASSLYILEQATSAMRQRTCAWMEFVDEVSSAESLDESEESLCFSVAVLQMEVKKMTAMLALLKVSYLKTELSARWKPFQKDFRTQGKKAIRAAAEMRNAHIAMEKALLQRLPHSTTDKDISLSAEQSHKMVEYSHQVWGISPPDWR